MIDVGVLMSFQSTYLVRRKSLKKIYCSLKEIWNLLLGLVVGIARWVKGADACAVLAPLMLPEGVVIVVVVLPVGLHVVEQRRLAKGGQDTGDIGVGAAGVAVGIVRAVTVIRPQTMNGP